MHSSFSSDQLPVRPNKESNFASFAQARDEGALPTPESSLPSKSPSLSASSSGITTKSAEVDVFDPSKQPHSIVGAMDQPLHSQFQGNGSRSTSSPLDATYATADVARDSAQSSAHLSQLGTAAPSAHVAASAAAPSGMSQVAPYGSMGMQAPSQQSQLQSRQGQIAATAQASSYFVPPVPYDSAPGNRVTAQPVNGQQAYPFMVPQPREEIHSMPPEQQYEEYMHNTCALGLAAAMYHEPQAIPSVQPPRQTPTETVTPQPAATPTGSASQLGETGRQASYHPYNFYEQQGLVPAPAYYQTDVPMLHLQGGGAIPPIPGLPSVPGFTVLHPALGQSPLTSSALGHSIDPLSAIPSQEPKKGVKSRRSTTRYHECAVCGKRFGRPSALQTHVYSHTGEKPYKCDFEDCSRCFSVLSNLRRHQRIHHGATRPGSASP